MRHSIIYGRCSLCYKELIEDTNDSFTDKIFSKGKFQICTECLKELKIQLEDTTI